MSSLSVISECAIKLSPSSLYNNLTYANNTTAFASKKDAIVVKGNVGRVVPLPEDKKGVVSLSLLQTANRSLLFITSLSTTVVWDIEKDASALSIPHVDLQVTCAGVVDVSGRGDRVFLAAGLQSGKVHFTSIDCTAMTTTSIGMRDGHEGQGLVTTCKGSAQAAASPVSVVSGSAKGELIFWDSSSAVVSRIAASKDECVTGVAIDTTYIAAAFGAGTIKLFNAATGRLHMEILAHAKWINALAYDPTSRFLASCGDDGLVCVWGLPTEADPRAAKLVGYAQRQNSLWTGVAFTAPGVVAAVAYDSDKITTFNAL